jgi:hypothetical protein
LSGLSTTSRPDMDRTRKSARIGQDRSVANPTNLFFHVLFRCRGDVRGSRMFPAATFGPLAPFDPFGDGERNFLWRRWRLLAESAYRLFFRKKRRGPGALGSCP